MQRMTFNGRIFSEYMATLYPRRTPLARSNYQSIGSAISAMLNISHLMMQSAPVYFKALIN